MCCAAFARSFAPEKSGIWHPSCRLPPTSAGRGPIEATDKALKRNFYRALLFSEDVRSGANMTQETDQNPPEERRIFKAWALCQTLDSEERVSDRLVAPKEMRPL